MESNNNTFQISGNTITFLQNELPTVVLEKLKIIENKSFNDFSTFEENLKLILGEHFDTSKEIIFQNSEIIEGDEDTLQDDLYLTDNGQGSIYPYDPSKADIDIREEPQTVFELVVRKWMERNLVEMPEFQRNFVWKPEQQSLFIESILLNFPLPPFYINKDVKGRYLVVDGRQRLTTLRRFLENKFPLSNLKAFPQLNGCTFKDLIKINPDYQTKIEDKKLLVYLIQPSVPLEMVYDIFNRINTGGTQLERQEIRNCIYIGKAPRLLEKLAHSVPFTKAIDSGISSNRVKDEEAVLRVLAFMILDYKNEYKGSMNEFVERAMKLINSELSEQKIKEYEDKFNTAMNTTFLLFGKNNFRLPTGYTRGRVNIAVLESVSFYFKDIKFNNIDKDLKSHYNKRFKELLRDEEYYNAVRFSTGTKAKVLSRFQRVYDIFDDIAKIELIDSQDARR